MTKKGQQSFLLSFLFAFLFFAFIGVVIFSFATSNVTTQARGYNQTTLARLDISTDVSDSFSDLEGIVNPENQSGLGAGATQTDNLLFTAADLGRTTFDIPQFIYGIFELASEQFGIDPKILMFVTLAVVSVLIVIFIQIALGRY